MRSAICSMLVLSSASGWAATAPVFRFTETWVEQVQAVRDECDTPPCPVYYDEMAVNRVNYRIIIPWDGIDPYSLSWDTPFSLVIGGWRFEHVLSEDPNFSSGVGAVTFVEAYENALGRRVVLNSTTVRWRSDALVITGYDRLLVTSLIAGDYLDTAGSFRTWVPAEVTLGGYSYSRQIFARGVTTVRPAVAGPIGLQQTYFLSTVIVNAAADFARPTVAIGYPRGGARLTSDTITVRGSARDNSGVTRVMVQANDEKFVPADGTNAWTAEVTLIPGLNVIRAKALDSDDNESAVAIRRVTYVVTSALALNINPPGSGRVTGVADGGVLEVGRQYRAVAWPLGTNLFAGWTGDTPGPNALLSFAMQSNMTLTANFVPNPFLARRGTYAGLFLPGGDVATSSAENAGAFRLVLNGRGVFSGSVLRAGVRHGFTGRFGLDGTATVTARSLSAPPLTVTLQLDVSGTGGVTGEVTDGGWSSEIRAGHVAASGLQGRYNLVIEGNDDSSAAPGGAGVGAVSVSAGNSFLGSISLGDGTPLAVGGVVTHDGEWPLFASLYGGRGLLLGWIQFDAATSPATLSAKTVRWIKSAIPVHRFYPNGFEIVTALDGSRYTPPAAGQSMLPWSDGVVRLSGGNLNSTLSTAITVTGNKVSCGMGNPQSMLVTLRPLAGAFTGRFRHPESNQWTPFRGRVLPSEGGGAGWFAGADQTGRVRIEAP